MTALPLLLLAGCALSAAQDAAASGATTLDPTALVGGGGGLTALGLAGYAVRQLLAAVHEVSSQLGRATELARQLTEQVRDLTAEQRRSVEVGQTNGARLDGLAERIGDLRDELREVCDEVRGQRRPTVRHQ